MEGQIYDLLKEIGEVKSDVAHIKSRLDSQKETNTSITSRLNHISQTLDTLEDKMFPRKDIDMFFNQVRTIEERVEKIEEAPDMKKVAFVNKLIAAGLAVIMAGLAALGISFGKYMLTTTSQWHMEDVNAIKSLRIQQMPHNKYRLPEDYYNQGIKP
jgi:seryl-tRNA synthetase